VIPCAIESCLFHLVTVRAARPITVDHLADCVRWTGVAVAVAGAFEAAPAGSAKIWRRARRWALHIRAWLARYLPWLKSSPVNVHGVAAGVMVMAKAGAVATGTAWNQNAPAKEQIEALHQRCLHLEARVADVQRLSREHAEAVRAEVMQAAGELRAASSAITLRISDMETRSARTDARGICVVVVGIILTGVPDGLATCALIGWGAIAGALALALRFGVVIIREERGQDAGA
jgi:hypothetical protein